MFEVSDVWQGPGSEVLQAIFFRPGVRRYRLVELSLNVQLFHVDIQTSIEGELYWSRCILDNIQDVLHIASDGDPGSMRISLQSRREDALGYAINFIDEIFESVSRPGVYLFKCDDGVVRSDSVHELVDDDNGRKLVWSAAWRPD